MLETKVLERGVCRPFPPILGREVAQHFGVISLLDPYLTHASDPPTHIDRDLGVRITSRGIV
jgi:hypothetical protein